MSKAICNTIKNVSFVLFSQAINDDRELDDYEKFLPTGVRVYVILYITIYLY